jgi:hypothetical protein
MRSTTNDKNDISFYLEKIYDLEYSYTFQKIEFDCLRAFSTAGDILPPYSFQWIAYTKVREGDDDPFEGLGETPFEAMKNLYKVIKKIKQNDNH